MCIHRMKIVHRDLKSANCLVNKHWTVKICDFGLSRVMIDSPMTDNSSAGTPEWMAPELIRNEPFTEKCDIFSLGVIMWELCTLSRPWEGISPVQVIIHPLFYRYSCSMHAFPKGVCWLKHVVHFYVFAQIRCSSGSEPETTFKVPLWCIHVPQCSCGWESC
jgi:serine/threonine protein kinase